MENIIWKNFVCKKFWLVVICDLFGGYLVLLFYDDLIVMSKFNINFYRYVEDEWCCLNISW